MCICGDNVEVNKALANLCDFPLLGCNFHRFNLADVELFKKHIHVIDKIILLMGKLKSLKLSGKLREVTYLRPVQKKETRCLSCYQMLERFFQLKEFLVDGTFATEKVILDYLPSPLEILEIQSLLSTMKNFQSVTLALHRETVCMADVKNIFEQMCIDYPVMSKYLKPDAIIIHSTDFENAITKIQNCATDTLSEEEKEQLSNLKYPETSGRGETES